MGKKLLQVFPGHVLSDQIDELFSLAEAEQFCQGRGSKLMKNSAFMSQSKTIGQADLTGICELDKDSLSRRDIFGQPAFHLVVSLQPLRAEKTLFQR